MAGRDLLLQSAKNLCWMAETIHQNYHQGYGEEHATWKSCNRGVCGSMEYMLAQIGFDKNLNRQEPIP